MTLATEKPATLADVTAGVTSLVADFLSTTSVHALATEAAAVRHIAQRKADLVSEIARQLVPLIRQSADPERFPEAAAERDALVARLKQTSKDMALALIEPTLDRQDAAPLTKHGTDDCQWCSGYETGVTDSLIAAQHLAVAAGQ